MSPFELGEADFLRRANESPDIGPIEHILLTVSRDFDELSRTLDAIGRRGEDWHVHAVLTVVEDVLHITPQNRPERFFVWLELIGVAKGVGIEPLRHRKVYSWGQDRLVDVKA